MSKQDDDEPVITRADYENRIAERLATFNTLREQDADLDAMERFIPPSRRLPREPGIRRQTAVRAGKRTVTTVVLDAVEGARRGVSYAALRDHLKTTEEIAGTVNEKAFHRALYNLQVEGKIVKHNEHVFTPAMFAAHMERVSAGEIEDVVAQRMVFTPVTTAILEYVESKGGWVSSRDIFTSITRDPAIKSIVNTNSTQYYNMLARLVSKGALYKDDDTRLYRVPSKGDRPDAESASPEGEADRSEGAKPSLNGSKPLNGAPL